MGVKSTAILFGDADRLAIGVLQGLSVTALYLAGLRFELGMYFNASLLVVVGLFVYQQRLIKERKPDALFLWVNDNNWVGLAVFIGIALHYQLA